VGVLERRKEILVFREGASWSLFPAGSRVSPTLAGLHKDADVMRLWQMLEATEDMAQHELLQLTNAWGWIASSTLRRVNRLVQAGVLVRLKEPNRRILYRVLLRTTGEPEFFEDIDAF
jgi:hypothetical protein